MPFWISALLCPLNDATTALVAPPVFEQLAQDSANQGRDMSFSEDSARCQKRLYPDLAPLTVSLPPARAFALVRQEVQKFSSWTVFVSDPIRYRLEAVDTTRLMKFKDDVVIEVRPGSDGSEIHMRSKSRVGRSDLGANAQRIHRFLNQLEAVISIQE